MTGTISKLATSFVLKLVKNQTQIGQDTVKQKQTTAEKDETATEYQQPNPWVKSNPTSVAVQVYTILGNDTSKEV